MRSLAFKNLIWNTTWYKKQNRLTEPEDFPRKSAGEKSGPPEPPANKKIRVPTRNQTNP